MICLLLVRQLALYKGGIFIQYCCFRRMAHEYLKSMKGDSDSDAESADSFEVSNRLRKERLESEGMYYRYAKYFLLCHDF